MVPHAVGLSGLGWDCIFGLCCPLLHAALPIDLLEYLGIVVTCKETVRVDGKSSEME